MWNDGRVPDALRIDCWADLTCPFCYLARVRLGLALGEFAHGSECVVVHRAFELDPHARSHYDQPLVELLARKYAMPLDRASALHHQLERQAAELGMTWSMASARPSNTFDAHRVIKHAETTGRGDDMLGRLFAAYFCEGELLSDRGTLARLATELGVDDVAEVLATDAYADEVRLDEAEAESRDIAGVPHLVVDGKFTIAGARDVPEMVDVLERAWRRRAYQSAAPNAH